jgi:hypothetical protein
MFLLACISTDGKEMVVERNIFSEDKTFSTIEEAWERNDDMGSRWVFYPFRFVVNADEKTIASVPEDFSHSYVGSSIQEVMDYFAQEYST